MALLLSVILAGAAGMFSLLVGVQQALGIAPMVWAGIAGIVISSLRLVGSTMLVGASEVIHWRRE